MSALRFSMRPKDFQHVSAKLAEAANEAQSSGGPIHRDVARLQSIHAQMEALSRGDVASVLEQALPDVELEIFAPLQFPWVTRARGIEEVEAAIAHNFDTLDDQQPEITNVLTEGDAVVLIGRERGIIRATGERYDVQFVHRLTFVNDQLAAVRIIAANTEPGAS